MKKHNILLIEDDPDLGSLLAEYLRLKDFNVGLAPDGKSAHDLFSNESWDLIAIDVMLPDANGFDLAKDFRAKSPATPFIFITAKNRKEEVIAGLKTGAEDYITKPFDPEELILRLNVILRRNRKDTGEDLEIGNSRLIYNQMCLESGRNHHKLTSKEFDVLSYLIIQKNKLIKREVLLEKFWGENDYFKGRSMDVFISRFRKYLSGDELIEIETFRGSGYILREKA